MKLGTELKFHLCPCVCIDACADASGGPEPLTVDTEISIDRGTETVDDTTYTL